MSKTIEFLVPVKDRKSGAVSYEVRRGHVAWFEIGGRRIKFVIQNAASGKPIWLTHWATGYDFGSLDDARIELMCHLSPWHKFSPRMLAQHLISKAVARNGADTVLALIDAVEVINLDHAGEVAATAEGAPAAVL